MAQQKMHNGFQRTKSDTQKISEEVKDSLSRKFREQDVGGSSLARSFDSRYAFLTFLTLESDGHWRIIALPVQFPDHPDHFVSGAQGNMDGLHLVRPPSISSFKAGPKNVRNGPPPDGTYSVKSFAARSFPGSNVQHQSRNKALANNSTKLNEIPSKSSCQSLFICSKFHGLNPTGINAINSSDIFNNNSQVDKAVKRNSRKKARKKVKQSRKLSYDSGSTELEVLSTHGSLTSETCGNNDVDHGDGPVSSVAPEDSLPDVTVDRSDFEGNKNGIVNCSETSKTCSSYVDEVDVSEAITPVVQNFTGEHLVCSSEDLFQTKDFSIFDVRMEDTHCRKISCYDDMCSKGLSDIHDSIVLDSVSVVSNSDDSIHAGLAVQQTENESCGINLSESPGFNSRKGNFSHRSSLNGIADNCNRTEGTKHGSRGSSCSDAQLVVPGKRRKQKKAMPRSSSVHGFGSVGHLHGRTGKENNHSVWQKVRRNEANGCNEFKKVTPICSQSDVTLKEAPLLKRTCNVVDVNLLSKGEDKKHLKDKVSRKLKKNKCPASKQEHIYSRKGSHADKASSNSCAKSSVQQNEISDISSQVNDRKGLSTVSRSHSQINSHGARFHSSGFECVTSESVHSARVFPDELQRQEIICNTVSSISLPNSCDSLDQSNLLEVHSPVYLPHLLINEVGQTQKEIPLAEHSKQNHSTGSISQKWIPIGMKDHGLTSSARSDCSSLEHSDVPAAGSWTLKNTVEGKMTPISQNLVSSLNTGVTCKGQSSGSVNCSSEDEGQTRQLGNQDACTLKENDTKYVAANYLTIASMNQYAFETDLEKIARAVNDSCRAQLASEAFQMATGGPIAEFERLLHFSSPVICHSSNLISCQTCLRDQVGGVPMCRHEIPNISLGSLWQWYEKHGSYGLEIMAEDYENSKRLGVDRFAFRAYFVPFLSAVQLFRKRKSHSINTSKEIPSPQVREACETSETSEKSSNVSHLPIFSVLFPQPHIKDASILPHLNQACSSGKDDIYAQSVDMTSSSDFELLFEFFESEQPQQRRPLYEKIKELVRGDGPSHCKVYGDPTKLESLNLHDLHPSSWYSVAWYPIYRIPDGNFRSAFLTYHSLGHLVRGSAKYDIPSADACIVSPVVGLQSYNAQGECWFQPRQSLLSQTAKCPGLNPLGILKERLRTLEETASVMARAVVNKGNLTSANRHPDYEFFLSRRRCQ